MTIKDIITLYRGKLDHLDIELILAHSLKKTREFILTYPEQIMTKKQETIIKKLVMRRIKGEPIAYIVGYKEFYGLDFIVNKNTLVPRPETEMLIDQAICESRIMNHESCKKTLIADIGTGSGNIVISIAKKIKDDRLQITDYSFYAIDISKEALKIARLNAKKHKVDKKIKFLRGDLLSPLKNLLFTDHCSLIIFANLPYLSNKIYSSAPNDVRKYEPKSALYSSKAGLAHYHKLFKQINIISKNYKPKTINCILEFSPEQKRLIAKMIKNIFPLAKFVFVRDLAGKWRVCKVII